MDQINIDLDKPGEFCGVVGIYGTPDAAVHTYLCLHALQHRGQESAGIAASDGETVKKKLGMGLVSDIFDEQSISELKGHIAIGQRWPTHAEGRQQAALVPG